VVAFIGLSVMAAVVPGISVSGPGAGALAVVVFWAFNLLIRPVILALFAPISTILVIAASLVLQVAAILILEPLVPGVEISGIPAAFVGSWVFAIVNTILTAILSISEDDSHFGALVRRLRMQRADAIHTAAPGLVIVQMDGLSNDVLKQQLHAGRVPVISRWIRDGSHRLTPWDVLLPSQTSASQAGILHGNNDGIPAFRWWEKETSRLLVSNHPADAAEIVRRVSNGEGLLSCGGASVNNLASGDAPRAYLTMSTLAVRHGGLGDSEAFNWFFLSPYNYLHLVVRFIGESAKEVFQARRQVRADVQPRMPRGFPYPFLRATTNIVLRALGTSLVLEEMYRGTPVIYIDFTDYDEIAHHSGPERPDALDALDGIDRVLGTFEKAAEDASRPYRFIVLSDHGQTLGATFRQRFGESLEEVVRGLMMLPVTVAATKGGTEEMGPINAFVAELKAAGGLTGRMTRAMDRRADEPGRAPAPAPSGTGDSRGAAPGRDVVVAPSGNLALISFPAVAGRLTLESIDELHPGLLDGLANHPGIGFVMVRSGAHGPVAIGRQGIRFLPDERVEGRDPLESYGKYAAAGLLRIDGMANAPDIVVISTYDPETDEVAAFEELIGSHGGLGGAQTRPFLLSPADWPLDEGPLVGAPAIYRQIRTWMEGELGMRLGPPGGSTPPPAEGIRTPTERRTPATA
jgi:uncharacterized membrane protein YvlD (DUF360 family)